MEAKSPEQVFSAISFNLLTGIHVQNMANHDIGVHLMASQGVGGIGNFVTNLSPIKNYGREHDF